MATTDINPIGIASADFLSDGQTIKNTALVDLVNRVQLYYGNADLSSSIPLNPNSKIPQGAVTASDISSIYPYQNYLYTISVTGAQIRKYLEFSVSRYYKTYATGDISIAKNSNVQDYNLEILFGANYIIDLTKTGLYDANGNSIPEGQPRIVKLTYNGKDVLDNQIFKLALSSYRIGGGGGFLQAAGIKPQTSNEKLPNYIYFDSKKTFGTNGLISNLIIRYFQETAQGKISPQKTVVDATYNNNWFTIPRFYDLIDYSDLHGDIADVPTSNAALMAGTVNNERSIYGSDRTLLLAGGDMLQGSSVSNILKGKPVIDIMNEMKFDAIVTGNHEYDWGLDVLVDNIKKSNFPYLIANMTLLPGDTDAKAKAFFNNYKPWVILNKDGLKIGIIGVVDKNSSIVVSNSIMSHFNIEDPATTINILVPQLKSAGADIVVVLAHIGDQYNSWPTTGTQPESEPLSLDLANLVSKISGVSAVLGGNSHSINYDLVNDATGRPIPVIVGSNYGTAVIRLALDDKNNIIVVKPGFLDIYNRLLNSIKADSRVQGIVDLAKQEITPIINQVIGKTTTDLTRWPSGDAEDSNLGNFVSDVIKNSVKADCAILNFGALRVDIPAGDITIGQMWTLMPFDNQISVMYMTGLQIKTVLEYMVSGIMDMGHISGISFKYQENRSPRFSWVNGTVQEKTENQRVVWVSLPDGSPLILDKMYRVAAPDFVALGGDCYPIPANSSNLQNSGILVRDALINYLKTNQNVNYQSEKRISIASMSSYDFITPDLSNIAPEQEYVKELTIKTIALGDAGYLKGRINISIMKPTGAKVEMLYFDKLNNKYVDVAQLGFVGNKDGTTITPDYSCTNTIKFKFSKAGIYTIRYALVDLITNEEIIADTSNITVKEPIPSVSCDLPKTAIKGQATKFKLYIKANSYANKKVMLKISVKDQDKKPTVHLKYLDLKKPDLRFNKDGIAIVGDKDDFLLKDGVANFEIKFDKKSNYQYKFEFLDIESEKILASLKGTVSVTDKRK